MSIHFLSLRFEPDGGISSSFGANIISPPAKGEVAMCGLEGDVRGSDGRYQAFVDYVLATFPEDPGNWYCFDPHGRQCPFPGHPDWRNDIYDESMSLSPFRVTRPMKRRLNTAVKWV